MKKFVTTIAIVLATASVAAADTNQGGHQYGKRRAEFRRLAEALNLTPEQKQQLKAQRTAARQRNEQLFTTFRSKRQELRQLLAANDPAADNVKAELQAMRPQLKAAREQARTEMRSILTPEQLDHLDQLRAQHRKH
ncbi:MAG: periplasmic heavy metal sensor [Acidobacteriota bacterium]